MLIPCCFLLSFFPTQIYDYANCIPRFEESIAKIVGCALFGLVVKRTDDLGGGLTVAEAEERGLLVLKEVKENEEDLEEQEDLEEEEEEDLEEEEEEGKEALEGVCGTHGGELVQVEAEKERTPVGPKNISLRATASFVFLWCVSKKLTAVFPIIPLLEDLHNHMSSDLNEVNDLAVLVFKIKLAMLTRKSNDIYLRDIVPVRDNQPNRKITIHPPLSVELMELSEQITQKKLDSFFSCCESSVSVARKNAAGASGPDSLVSTKPALLIQVSGACIFLTKCQDFLYRELRTCTPRYWWFFGATFLSSVVLSLKQVLYTFLVQLTLISFLVCIRHPLVGLLLPCSTALQHTISVWLCFYAYAVSAVAIHCVLILYVFVHNSLFLSYSTCSRSMFVSFRMLTLV